MRTTALVRRIAIAALSAIPLLLAPRVARAVPPFAPSAPPASAAATGTPATPPAVSAAANGRFHVLTPALAARVDARAQSNIAATGRWREGATAFLVYRRTNGSAPADSPREGTERALVLTNAHVAGHRALSVAPGAPITFPDGEQAKTVRMVASSQQLDYALVEVELPTRAAAQPVTLRRAPPRTGEGIYAVSGFTNIDFPKGPAQAVAIHAKNEAVVTEAMKDKKSIPTIQLGTIHDGKTLTIYVASGTSTVVRSNLPNRPGTSGSPVFSRDDHRVIALHAAGDPSAPSWVSSEVPMKLILDHLSNELRAGRVPKGARDLTRALLAGSSADDAAEQPAAPAK